MNKKELLIELSKRCKEERLKKNISLRELHNITYIPIDILKSLEDDEEYIIKEPYSKFLLKFIAKNLGIDISDIESLLNKPEEEKPQKKVDLKKGVNTTISTVLAMSTIIYATNANKIQNQPDKFETYLKLVSEENINFKENNLYSYNTANFKDSYEEKNLELMAEGRVWITAYIDGKEKVIKLVSNEKKNIKFFNKIKFETIGNADKLFISFKGKTVKLTDNSKILHNIFVDEEGIFINGYNILENSNLAINENFNQD